jgi:hypothetical protein
MGKNKKSPASSKIYISLAVYIFVFAAWALYRFIFQFRLPMAFDELFAKPFIWGLPLLFLHLKGIFKFDKPKVPASNEVILILLLGILLPLAQIIPIQFIKHSFQFSAALVY